MLRHMIESKAAGMTSAQKKIAEYVLDHFQQAGFQAASQLAEAIGVSEASVVRMSQYLGFSSYAEFKQEAYQEFISSLSASKRMSDIAEGGRLLQEDNANPYAQVLQRDIDAIQSAQKNVSYHDIGRLASEIDKASCVYVAAIRGSGISARHLAYHLSWILPCVRMLDVSSACETLVNAPKDSLLIVVDFPRYVNWSISVLRTAHQIGIKTACITDSHSSPYEPYSNLTLTVPYRTVAFVDSCACVISVMNCIILAVSKRNQSVVTNRLKQLEYLWQQENVYAGEGRIWLSTLSRG
ncbi:MurR/RpiR family transcriptional regulator [Pyramidobacter sp. SM-530-WT-4B]|uniref:MurR/RpiR family transcriptional regulator n=1 Tax=Pyramidobacter porci TaxID=2605789 RepID=A0A6L5Y927_9BACT|nr:MurR/RpiR family transcriptional regulator [Pyramidobacter porci]MCI6259746.1 MurR/RpiR family transcriptional regulator [Pyramidobacter sp.]MST54779.1 MurR/RpiR family transcriptional regulator [Pyramidobacter porci]